MRFKVYEAPNRHPVLAFCNAKSKTFFWDMARLTAYQQFKTSLNNPNKGSMAERPPWLTLRQAKRPSNNPSRIREPSDRDSMVSAAASPDPNATGSTSGAASDGIRTWEEMYDISHPQDHPIRPHKTVGVSGESNFVGRQVAWSPDGQWCVVVGNQNRALIFQRWAKDK
jgi:polycomb protein EED